MDKQNFLAPEYNGKFPISANTFEFMQNQTEFVSSLGSIFGQNVLLKFATSTRDGLIIFKGELFPLRYSSGEINYYNLVEETENITAQGVLYKDARKKRYVIGGVSSYGESVNRNAVFDLTGNKTANITNQFLPKGAIIMWSGSIASIPAGYVLCDGRAAINGVTIPNLQGRFIVGYSSSSGDYHTIGSTGGEEKHTLTAAEMPQHRHGIVGEAGEKSGTGTAVAYVSRINDTAGSGAMVTGRYETSTAGSSNEHENRPPYYVLAFLIKVI